MSKSSDKINYNWNKTRWWTISEFPFQQHSWSFISLHYIIKTSSSMTIYNKNVNNTTFCCCNEWSIFTLYESISTMLLQLLVELQWYRQLVKHNIQSTHGGTQHYQLPHQKQTSITDTFTRAHTVAFSSSQILWSIKSFSDYDADCRAISLTIIFDLSPVGLLRWNNTPSKSKIQIYSKKNIYTLL